MRGVLAEVWAAGWDGFAIRHAWRSGAFSYELRRDFAADVRWEAYGKEFSTDTLLHADAAEASGPDPALIADLGPNCAALVAAATGFLERGRGEQVVLRSSQQRGMGVLANQHSSLPGSANGLHIVTAGGIRRHELDDEPESVVLDGLNLARAMTYKNVAAGMKAGGSKLVLCSDPLDPESLADLGFVAYCIDAARTMTGPDMGLSPRHADALIEHFTRNITGGERSLPTGPPTAHGVTLAIETILRHRRGGSFDWREVSVGVQGLGAVGGTLADELLERGATVIVADVSPQRVEGFLAAHAGAAVSAVGPDEILTAEVDVLSPAAVGGVIDEALIARLRCDALIGAANNMLAADSPAEEQRLARLLADRGIFFLTEWQLNVGGVLAGWEGWKHGEEAALADVYAATEPRCTTVIGELLEDAGKLGTTPTELAYARVDEVLGYPAQTLAR
jgi:leucine dehydrogenase